MPDVLEAPDAPFRLLLPIEHITKLDDGTLLVHTVATDESPDSQGEIVDYDAAKAAAPALMEWATLGEMHDPGRMDAGTILKLHFDDAARRIEADLHVVDPVAVRKVLNRVYKAVSIGGVKLQTIPVQIAGRVFRKITRLLWEEISLVNRGANPNALIAKQFLLAKRDVPGDERDAMDASDFAGRDRSYPIHRPKDVAAAAASIGRAGPDNYSPDELRSRITAIARRKGPAFVAQLPKSWREPIRKARTTTMPDTIDAGTTSPLGEPTDGDEPRTPQQAAIDATLTALAKAEPPFPGAKEPFGAKKAAKKAAKAKKHATVVVAAPETHGEPDGDEADDGDGDEAGKVAKASPAAAEPAPARKRLTKAQRLAKRVRALRKANRRLAKARRRLAKRATPRVMLRTLAKAGARNSKADQKLIEQGHDVFLKLGYSKCMAKADGLAASEPTGSSESPIAKAGAPEAIPATMREALAGILPTATLDAMEARLAALDERSRAQGEQLAKIAKSPTAGGPATPYAAVFRGAAADGDPASVLEKAAAVIDDPRLKEQVGSAAAAEMIRQARKG